MRQTKTRLVSIPALATLLLWAPIMLAAQSLPSWELLQRALEAERHISYRGTQDIKVYLDTGVRTSQSLVLHQAPSRHRIVYYSPPTLAGVVVQDEGPVQRMLNPEGQMISAGHAWQPGHGAVLEARRLLLIRSNYTVQRLGQERIATRPTVILSLMAKTPGNPWRKLWIDEETSVILKNEGYNAEGRLATVSQFREIAFDPVFTEEEFAFAQAEPARGHAMPHMTCIAMEGAKLAFDPVLPRYLPEGYVFEEGHLMAGSAPGVLHLAFTDGLNTISLFERPVTGPSAPSQEIRTGTGQEKVLTWTAGTLAYTLIGDLPGEELRKIARSVKER